MAPKLQSNWKDLYKGYYPDIILYELFLYPYSYVVVAQVFHMIKKLRSNIMIAD